MVTIDELINYPVNWTDGMRVASKDFIDMDNAWSDALRDVRVSVLQGIQFGVLPPLRESHDKSNYPKFRFDQSRNELTLLECRAITEGGYRIEITERLFREYKIPLKLPAVKLEDQEDQDVYITVRMEDHDPCGPLSADAPPRHLYKSPACELSVLPKKTGLSGVNHLKIAELKWIGGGLEQDNNYIPPCFTVNSHPKLQERHQRIGGILQSMLEISLKLVQDYRLDSRTDVKDGAGWLEILLLYLSSNLWTYKDLLPEKNPVYTINFLKNWLYYVEFTASARKSNPFLAGNLEVLKPSFNSLAKNRFDVSELKSAFDQLEDTLKGIHRWLKNLEDSFRQGVFIKVEQV